ncbi:MAG: hypothetical protein ABSD71_13740 [Bacteroidales bacterium]|jgi:hypothetical protein
MAGKINNFSDNVPRWLSIAELRIDYYTQFIKSWIPFNAWYMVSYYDEDLGRKTDRNIIDHIKKNSNLFKDRIINLLNGNDNTSNKFKFSLGQLHLQLEAHSVPSHDSKLSFASICIAKNQTPQHSIPYRNFLYRVSYNIHAPKTTKRLVCEIIETKKTNATIYWDDFYDWSLSDFLNSPKYKALTKERREKLRLCFEQVNPDRPENIILAPVRDRSGKFQAPKNSITIDNESNIYVTDDIELVSKVLIEILYRLRCALFHGEINPTETNQEIYKHAYDIQKIIIQELK